MTSNQKTPILSLQGVKKQFGSTVVVEDLHLAVQENELITFLGPSGCGKTTTLRMIAGFEYPTHGSIFIAGKDVTAVPPHKREIGIVFQSYSLFPHLTISENVAYGLKRRGVARSERNERVKEVLNLVDLAQYGERYPSELSGGQQQRVAIARAIVIRPKILLLDEPLSALDAKLRQRMRTEIRHLQRQIGMTTILVTHDQEEALAMSDRIVVMNRGRVEQFGTPSHIYKKPATTFVANFVGETNLIPGIVAESDVEGCNIFRAECGFEACFKNINNLSAGQKATLSLRPESLNIGATASADSQIRNTTSGQVRQISYLGSRTIFEIKTATRNLLVSTPSQTADEVGVHELFAEGQTIQLTWKPEACQVLEEA